MIYLINEKMHTSHTVKEGSSTYNKIIESNAKTIKIGRDLYSIHQTYESALGRLAILQLTGGAE